MVLRLYIFYKSLYLLEVHTKILTGAMIISERQREKMQDDPKLVLSQELLKSGEGT